MREVIPQKYAVFLKYAIVGCIGTALDVGSLYVFVGLLHINLLIAAALSFILAVVNNFILNKHWTFQNKSSNVRKQFIKFLIVSMIGLLLTEIFMSLLVYGLKLWYITSKLVTSVLVLMWNFLANKYWTFKDRIFYSPCKEHYAYDISVIVPAYNEGKRIKKTLEALNDYFSNKPVTRQIIVVDDGSNDNTTGMVTDLKTRIDNLTVTSYQPNRGKGYAVKTGVEASQGEYILFTDADNSTPIEEFDKFYPLLKDHEVVIGSRYAKGSSIVVAQPWYRVLIGRLANVLVQIFILDGVTDTQCGFKAFQHEAAREIFSRVKVNRFGFDIEILAIARLLAFSVREMPVSWYNAGESRVRPFKDALRTFFELIYIKLNLWGGRYI
ncbi:MAG TPA: GtrA family protein [Dissulfurispiraceae bacterium]|nr:GtrA family protein [Dissulfurispiraceae bacterium]